MPILGYTLRAHPLAYDQHMKNLAALAALPLLVLAACSSGSGDAAKTVTVSATPSSSAAADTEGLSGSAAILQQRSGLKAHGLTCDVWTSPSSISIAGAGETGQCDDDVLIAFDNPNSDDNVYLGMRATARDIAAKGGAAHPIILNKGDWWYLATSEDDADRVAALGAQQMP